MRTMKLGFTMLALALYAVPAFAAEGDVQVVEAEGRAAIERGDEAAALKRATDDAKRNAADQVGSEVLSDTVVENMELVRDRIVTKLASYVHNYKVLEKKKVGNDIVVRIEASVSTKQLKDDARLLYADMKKPRILILVSEVKGGDKKLSTLAENVLAEFLKEKEFELRDAEVVKANMKADEARAIAEGDNRAAAKIAASHGAEVLIVGTAEVSAPESVRGILYAAKANVQLRAIRADNAQVLAVSNVADNGIEGIPEAAPRKAITQAARKAGSDVFGKIVKEWNTALLNGSVTELQLVSGVDFMRLKRLKSELAKLQGIKEVNQRTFDAPTATLDITYLGDSEELAEALATGPVGGFTISVQTVGGGKIRATLK